MAEILPRDSVVLTTIDELSPVTSVEDTDVIVVNRDGVTLKGNIGQIREGFATDADLQEIADSPFGQSIIPESHLVTSWVTDGSSAGVLTTSLDTPSGQPGLSITLTHNGTLGTNGSNLIAANIPGDKYRANEPLTFSLWAKGSVSGLKITPVFKKLGPVDLGTFPSPATTLSTTWQKYSFTITPTEVNLLSRYEIRVGDNSVAGTFFFYAPKLERGAIATKSEIESSSQIETLSNKTLNTGENIIRLYNNTQGRQSSISIGVFPGVKNSTANTRYTIAELEAPVSPGTFGLGVKFNHERRFQNITSWPTTLNTPPSSQWSGIRQAYVEGREVHYTLMISDPGQASPQPAVLSRVLAGEFDDRLKNVGSVLRGLGKPIYLSIFHEFNTADWYAWGLNWNGTGGTTNNPDDFIPAYRRVVDQIRSVGGTENIKFELQYVPWGTDSGFDFQKFYPGDSYVDVMGVSIYNAVGRFGNDNDRSFRQRFREFYSQVTRFCNKPLSVSEAACHPDGYVAPQDITITNGGTGYTTATVTFSPSPATQTPGAPSPTATGTATIVGGVITGITMVNAGYGYTSAPTITITGDGTGATATCTITRVDRAQYYWDWFDCLKEFPRLAYVTNFFEGDIFNGVQSPMNDAEREAFSQGFKRLANREDISLVNINRTIRPNLLKGWSVLSRWTQFGTNIGTLSLESEVPRSVVNSGSSLGLTHNGTAGLANTNRISYSITYDPNTTNKPFTLSFWAKIVPTTDIDVTKGFVRISTQLNGGSFQTSYPDNLAINRVWQRYEISTSNFFSQVTSTWNVRFEIGQNNKAFKLLLWGIKFEEGDFATDYVDDILRLPTESGAVVGDFWRNGNSIQYRDSTNTTRTVLSGEGNLANLTSPTQARRNLATEASRTVSVTADYTIAVSEAGALYEIDASAGNIVITLPASASTSANTSFSFRRADASTNTVTIQCNGSNNILGLSTYLLREQRQLLSLMNSGTGTWYVISSFCPSLDNSTTSPGDFTVGLSNPNNSKININGLSQRDINFQNNAVNRWTLRANSDTETGSNVGSNFQLAARDDAGTLIDFPLTVTRGVGGNFTVARPFRVTNTTASTATTNGSGVFSGGLGVAGTINANALALNTALPITSGGTGSTTASAARTALGLDPTTAQYNASQLRGQTVNTTAPTENQILIYQSGQWRPLSAIQLLTINQGTANTQQILTSATLVAATGLSVTVTPKSVSSYFEIILHINGIYKQSADTWFTAWLRRGATNLAALTGTATFNGSTNPNGNATISFTAVDFPATTSAVTYSIWVGNGAGTGQVRIQSNNENSVIVVKEYVG